MLTSEQANFHHGFGRAWRQICQPIHITARKKRPRERIAIAAANLQNLQLVHIVANAKKDTASARKGPRVRDAIGVANLQKHEICKFWRVAQNEIHKEKGYNNNSLATRCRHETMVLST